AEFRRIRKSLYWCIPSARMSRRYSGGKHRVGFSSSARNPDDGDGNLNALQFGAACGLTHSLFAY
ncbi:hypothetical protein AB0J20_30900, partial [Micromonospora costi]|uniref:hypothetical protein n=1 Tax=Micromonospora costi TaxID=1530042 RepID=UPI00340B5884